VLSSPNSKPLEIALNNKHPASIRGLKELIASITIIMWINKIITKKENLCQTLTTYKLNFSHPFKI